MAGPPALVVHARVCMWKRAALLLLASACSGNDDVIGPFTGTPRRYVVDSFELPHDYKSAQAIGADLTGDGVVDNMLGSVIGTLTRYNDVTTHAADMLASGA